MRVLGIESSCDETAAAVLTDSGEVLSNVIHSQIEEHKPFGGVVPEIAARSHLEKIDIVVTKALRDASLSLSDIDAIAATCGPGLIGGVIVGATFAKTISFASEIPFIAVNHIEAHALSARITEKINFPYLLMLMSGGHCQICVVHDMDKFEILGKTVDDSVGESFDKVSKLLGFGYPGGPIIEKLYHEGNCNAFSLPRPMCIKDNCDFSFSGLKTAVLVASQRCQSEKQKKDLAASFQKTVAEILAFKMKQALKICSKKKIYISSVVVGGGVAANQIIRTSIDSVCQKFNIPFFAPPIKFCTDNGAMIAWAGIEKFKMKMFDGLDFRVRPRWDLSTEFDPNQP
ncbi:MAG: tRNA (adenosine(37)-N6)-threonylcarbamoyltransferase complex transferase subunit TsaD [Alphaproteobacteria bacterium]|nr:tRNA (adenosine(37)-N6)-threonylcarbamoyltransferase complex transferase subunit TsaD [Alphaproteobacteria bacterium]